MVLGDLHVDGFERDSEPASQRRLDMCCFDVHRSRRVAPRSGSLEQTGNRDAGGKFGSAFDTSDGAGWCRSFAFFAVSAFEFVHPQHAVTGADATNDVEDRASRGTITGGHERMSSRCANPDATAVARCSDHGSRRVRAQLVRYHAGMDAPAMSGGSSS